MSNAIPVSLGAVKAFILYGDRPALVDTGTPGSARRLLAGLSRNGVKPEDVGLLVITHVHSDHTGSLAAVVQATGAKLVAHRLEAESVRNAGAEPDILVDDESDLNPYGVAGKAIWTPGHTRGSPSVLVESGDAVVGDLVTPRFMAFGPPVVAFWAASREDPLASIRRILATNLRSSSRPTVGLTGPAPWPDWLVDRESGLILN